MADRAGRFIATLKKSKHIIRKLISGKTFRSVVATAITSSTRPQTAYGETGLVVNGFLNLVHGSDILRSSHPRAG